MPYTIVYLLVMYIYVITLLHMSKVRQIIDDKINIIRKLKFVHDGQDRKHSGKRKKCWWPALSPCPTMF